MVSTHGTKRNEVITQLKTKIKEIDYFKDVVFKSYKTKVVAPRVVLIHLVNDTTIDRTTNENIHKLTINILVKLISDLSADQESEMESFIDKVGLVEDKLFGIQNNEPYWEDLLISNVNYIFGQDKSVIWYNSLITLEVRKEWEV